ncbi:MAG: hypothetical protein IAG13_00330 [Deltaproteobacteria bacterium]|nr:hypothetical protein [Nannocystaceae bacterium]
MSILYTLALAAWSLLTVPGETEAQRLHRKGVQCQDEIERNDCAIENFEALMAASTTRRELVTDAMLRLIRLYRAEGDTESIKPLLRKYWDAGMRRESRGHVPYSTRYVPADFDVLINVDVERIIAAPITRRLGADARDTLFTCDAARRHDLEDKRRWNRAKRKAAKTGRKFETVVYEELERERQADAKREQARKNGDAGPRGQPSPIFFESNCEVALALGYDDLATWRRMTAMFAHENFARSVTLAQIPGLEAQLVRAVAEARLVEVARDHWIVPNLRYQGQEVELARLDHEELLIAPASIIDEIIAASRDRKRKADRGLEALVYKVPRDTGFFVVLTQDAAADLGFGAMKPSTRNFLQALLPKPKGIQIAGVFGDDFGLFTRVPTDNPVKGRLLVSIARSLIERQSEKDSDTEELLRSLDVAEATDRRALLASYVLSAAQIEKLVLD